jgi:hypothetical protein
MSLHPPTAICSGRLAEEERPRILLTNPESQRGSVHSTDQTEKERPEWIFPRCPASMEYMLGCSMIITDHEREGRLPEDLQILREDVWGDGDELDFVVRIHTGDSPLKRYLERMYFNKECTHGIVVVVPAAPMVVHMMNHHQLSNEEKEVMARQPLDMLLNMYLREETASTMQQMMQNNIHRH